MIKYLRNLKPASFKNKICLLRLDFNTEDNWRLQASLPTIQFLLKRCRAVVILSHKGKPNGFDKKLSLRPVVKELKTALKKPVVFLPHFRFREIASLVRSAPPRSLFLLENLRFLEGEADNSKILAEHLAMLGDVYVNDAFAVSHRVNASVVAITESLPSYAGLELEAEIKNLSAVMKKPKKPFVVILGGLKIEDKLRVVKNLKNKAEVFLIGGAFTDTILSKLKSPKILLPRDFRRDAGVIRDLGPKSLSDFVKAINKAKTIIWNGPIGDIGQKRFQNGTRVIAGAVVKNRQAFKVVGGGETVMFLKKLKLDKKINFISTGGGAMLDFLAGKKLPGIEVFKY